MKFTRGTLGLVAVLSLCFLGQARAAHLYVLPESARAMSVGRAVDVLIAQSEIEANIDELQLEKSTQGGAMWALIDAKVNHDRASKAESAIRPLRDALSGFDVEALALSTTKAALAEVPWFQATSVTFGRDTTPSGMNAALDAATNEQAAFMEYAYNLSASGAALTVTLTIQLASKAIPKGSRSDARFSPRHLIYKQTITSVVSLPAPSKSLKANVALWADQGGKPARQALTVAFKKVGLLLPRALTLTEADIKMLTEDDEDTILRWAYGDHLKDQGIDNSLLFDGGLENNETLSQ